MQISILFLETVHIRTGVCIYLCTTYYFIFYQSIPVSFYMKRFQLSKETLLFKNKFRIDIKCISKSHIYLCKLSK